jgi:3-oxoacyl-[acyl-carrier-protein] synthase III
MAFLKGFGTALPPRIVSNEELSALTGAGPDWILSVSGIEQRRWAADSQTVGDLASAAAKDCLERCGVQAASLGMIVVASGTFERSFPGPALAVAKGLGLDSTPAIDLPLPSAGAIFALSLATQLADKYGEILVIGAEKMSPVIARQPLEPGVAVLFGDGAGACLVSAETGTAQVVDCMLHSDGAYSEDLRLDFGAPLVMNGRAVIMQASRKIPRVISTLLTKYSVPPREISAFLMHQANQNLIDAVAKALGVASDRFFSNIRRYGNTSAASMLIAAAEWAQSTGFQKDIPVIFAGFGAGFHWGAMLAKGI